MSVRPTAAPASGWRCSAHVVGVAQARGCGRVEWAVLEWNSPAISFYESLGAETMDEWETMRLSGDALAAVASGR